ncbi:MAG: hypothetical protein KGH79_04515 [Patescibacteria group bacterium]|nr:hypothetical protein [Patescibacteria group bacterium]
MNETPIYDKTGLERRRKIRQAVEVLTGKEVAFPLLNFRTGRAILRVGDEEKTLLFSFRGEDRIIFTVGEEETCYAAFQANGEVFVGGSGKPWTKDVRRGKIVMRWAGRGCGSRRFEPVNHPLIRYFAQRLGISFEELLGESSSSL